MARDEKYFKEYTLKDAAYLGGFEEDALIGIDEDELLPVSEVDDE